MARLQKKKTPLKPRKKETSGDSEGRFSEAQQPADEKTASAGAGALSVDAGEKPKKAFTVKKPSTNGDPSAIMRLAEKYFGNWIQFLREVRVELTKVTWPSKKQTIGSTAVVIVFVFIVAFFLGLVDIGLSNFIRLFL